MIDRVCVTAVSSCPSCSAEHRTTAEEQLHHSYSIQLMKNHEAAQGLAKERSPTTTESERERVRGRESTYRPAADMQRSDGSTNGRWVEIIHRTRGELCRETQVRSENTWNQKRILWTKVREDLNYREKVFIFSGAECGPRTEVVLFLRGEQRDGAAAAAAALHQLQTLQTFPPPLSSSLWFSVKQRQLQCVWPGGGWAVGGALSQLKPDSRSLSTDGYFLIQSSPQTSQLPLSN